jgi:Beta protein
MFGTDHYVPILRAKLGEFKALGGSTAQVRDSFTPLIELPPTAWEGDEGEAAPEGPDPSLAGVAKRIEQNWEGDRLFFLDLGLVASTPALGGGVHPVELVFQDARTRGLSAIPVTSPGRDDAFQNAVRDAVVQGGRGVCIRLGSDDFDDVPAAFQETYERLAHFEVTPAETDLILDFGEVRADQAGPMVLAASAVIGSIPEIENWRTLTWAGTAFPSVQNFQASSLNTAPRGEWAIWQSLRSRSAVLPRVPSFADYTINGVQSDYDVAAAFFPSSPNLRYTAETDFLVWKARHPRHGHDQFNGICRLAIARPEFRGGGYSEGDRYIERCANSEDGPGNATSWRRAGVSHHLAAVVDQIASLP